MKKDKSGQKWGQNHCSVSVRRPQPSQTKYKVQINYFLRMNLHAWSPLCNFFSSFFVYSKKVGLMSIYILYSQWSVTNPILFWYQMPADSLISMNTQLSLTGDYLLFSCKQTSQRNPSPLVLILNGWAWAPCPLSCTLDRGFEQTVTALILILNHF